jgi:hypothetical protein
MPGLRVRLLADRSGGEPARSANLPGAPPGTWPLAGVRVEGEPPASCRIPTSWVARGIAAGWLTGEGHQVVTRPSGPAPDPWRPDKLPHIFHHYSALVLHIIDGDLRYRVTHQPDKYAADGADTTPVTDAMYAAGATRVDHFYGVELEG